MNYSFTDSVRHALARARDEAVRLRHEIVGPEHILLSLLADAEISALLVRLGAAPGDVHAAVARRLAPPGRGRPGPELPYTRDAKRVLEHAMTEARGRGDTEVRPEHLLAGVVRVGARTLGRFGLTIERLREEWRNPTVAPSSVRAAGDMQPLGSFTPAVLAVMSLAREEAAAMGHQYVGTEHLLLGLAQEPAIAAFFAGLGATVDRMREETRKLIGMEPGPSATPSPRQPRVDPAALTFTGRCNKVFQLAALEARGGEPVGAGHLLAGIVREGEGVATAVLNNLGIDLERLLPAVRRLQPASSSHGLRIDDASDRSIYEQLVEQVREAVARGRLQPGYRLPSVRALADELDIAPGTVARAYAELEQLGVVVTEGARGTRIAPRAAAGGDPGRAENLTGLLRPVVVAAFHLGATAAELRAALDRAMTGILNGGTTEGPGSAPA